MYRSRWSAVAACVLSACLCAVAGGQTPAAAALWSETFDSAVPGQEPAGWTFRWGNRGQEQFVVSNVESVSPPNSLMIDRRETQQPAQWGFASVMPEVADGWAQLSVDFRTDSAGEDRGVSIEIRDRSAPNAAIARMTLGGPELTLITLNRGIESTKKLDAAKLGAIEAGRWYRLQLWMPTPGGQQEQIHATLLAQNREDPLKWEAVGDAVQLKATWPERGYGQFYVNLGAAKRSLVYLDNIDLRRAAAPAPPAGE
jgi:hypothetical protein